MKHQHLITLLAGCFLSLTAAFAQNEYEYGKTAIITVGHTTAFTENLSEHKVRLDYIICDATTHKVKSVENTTFSFPRGDMSDKTINLSAPAGCVIRSDMHYEILSRANSSQSFKTSISGIREAWLEYSVLKRTTLLIGTGTDIVVLTGEVNPFDVDHLTGEQFRKAKMPGGGSTNTNTNSNTNALATGRGSNSNALSRAGTSASALRKNGSSASSNVKYAPGSTYFTVDDNGYVRPGKFEDIKRYVKSTMENKKSPYVSLTDDFWPTRVHKSQVKHTQVFRLEYEGGNVPSNIKFYLTMESPFYKRDGSYSGLMGDYYSKYGINLELSSKNRSGGVQGVFNMNSDERIFVYTFWMVTAENMRTGEMKELGWGITDLTNVFSETTNVITVSGTFEGNNLKVHF